MGHTVFAGVKAAVFLEEKYQKVGVWPIRKINKNKKSKSKPAQICTYGTRSTNGTITTHFQTSYRQFYLALLT